MPDVLMLAGIIIGITIAAALFVLVLFLLFRMALVWAAEERKRTEAARLLSMSFRGVPPTWDVIVNGVAREKVECDVMDLTDPVHGQRVKGFAVQLSGADLALGLVALDLRPPSTARRFGNDLGLRDGELN